MRNIPDRTRSATAPALLAAALGLLARADGAELRLSAERPFGWIGEAVVVEVAIVDPPEGLSYPTFPDVEGLRISRVGQSTNVTTDSRTRRMVQTITVSYQVAPVAQRPGTYAIGPAVAQRAGSAPLRSNTLELSFYRRRASALGIRTACRVEPEKGPLGAPFRVYYEVFHARPIEQLTDLELPVLKELPREWVTPVREVSGCGSQRLEYTDGTELYLLSGPHPLDDGYAEYRTFLAFDVSPYTTGGIALGGGAIGVNQHTGQYRRERGFFGDHEVPIMKEAKESFPRTSYEILPLPTANRPATFDGAIGRYSFSVSATPTMLDSGAPITLELVIMGDGYLPKVPPPPLARIPAITASFDVDTTTDPGEIEGRRKVFRKVIRPRTGDVTEIPPIPFAFFDPARGEYRTIHSEAIPIQVRSVRTVGAKDAIASTQATAPSSETSSARALAPAIFSQSGVAANRAAIGRIEAALDPRAELTSPLFLAVVVAPPVLFLGLVLHCRRGARDPRLVRARKALATASATLARCEDDHDAVSQAFQQYFRDRLGLGQGELTPRELESALARTRAGAEVVARARARLEELLAGRFGGTGASPQALAGQAREVLADVERAL